MRAVLLLLALVLVAPPAIVTAQTPPRISDPARVSFVWTNAPLTPTTGNPAFYEYRYDGEPTWTRRAAITDAQGLYRMPMRAPLAVGNHTLELRHCNEQFPTVCSGAVSFPFVVEAAGTPPAGPATIRIEITLTIP